MKKEIKYISIGQAAKLLGVCVGTIRSWVDKGKIMSYITPTKHRKILVKDIERITKSK